jgi:DNA-binding transcriptional MerR regulator
MNNPQHYLRTIDLARAVGVHVNTVRLYEKWGLIPPVERSPTGYRHFTPQHLDCLRLARMVYAGSYPGRPIRRSGVNIIVRTVSGDLGGALERAYQLKALVQTELAQAEAAVTLLERWASGAPPGSALGADATSDTLLISPTARLLGVSIDMLRNWERNGLISVPRSPDNRYRRYSQKEIGRLRVIRMLSRAGYSTMAILRMLTRLDAGETEDLRAALDTPRPDEDIFSASDRWLSTLEEHIERTGAIITHLEEMIAKASETS